MSLYAGTSENAVILDEFIFMYNIRDMNKPSKNSSAADNQQGRYFTWEKLNEPPTSDDRGFRINPKIDSLILDLTLIVYGISDRVRKKFNPSQEALYQELHVIAHLLKGNKHEIAATLHSLVSKAEALCRPSETTRDTTQSNESMI